MFDMVRPSSNIANVDRARPCVNSGELPHAGRRLPEPSFTPGDDCQSRLFNRRNHAGELSGPISGNPKLS
jgi:hypothetical protein